MALNLTGKGITRETSVCLTVFGVVLVIEHGEVTLVAALGDVVVFERLKDGTARFMGVCTVRETTVLGKAEDFLEITRDFLWLHVEGAEALNPRSVNEVAIPEVSDSEIISLKVVVC